MLKRFICGAFMVAALCGSGVAPAQADELYIRNRPFKDVYFSGGTAYVPVDGFLKAVKVSWSVDGSTVTVGQGSSPELSDMENVTVKRGSQSAQLSGIVRNGRLYVSSKELAKFTGYKVIHNRATGVVDVVKARFTNDSDERAAQEVADARQAEQDQKDAAWKARVEKARAARKAKEEAAKAAAEGDDEEFEDDEDSEDEDVLDAKGDPDTDPSDTKAAQVDGEEDNAFDEEDKSEEAPEEPKKKDPPPKADLVVLSAEAEPNNYDGTVVFRAVIQNQGYTTATGVRASFKVIGPDKKVWVSKNLYNADIAPDGRWVITENYRHRAASAIPRGDYDVQVVPTFKSAPPKE